MAMPIPNPYHRFAFSSGFTVSPPPKSPFKTASGNLMALFTPSDDPSAGPGYFGVGSLTDNPCFRFDFQQISLGCIGKGDECTVAVTGVQWNGMKNVDAGTRVWTVSACDQGDTGCELTEQFIDTDVSVAFNNLTAVKITARVDGILTPWVADDLRMTWTDNSCEAAVCRSKVRNSIMGWKRPASPMDKVRRFLRSAVRPAGAAEI